MAISGVAVKRNQFKYRCADCKAESWHHKHEFARAAQPYCPSCGSRFLESVTSVSRDRMALGQSAADERRVVQDAKMNRERK